MLSQKYARPAFRLASGSHSWVGRVPPTPDPGRMASSERVTDADGGGAPADSCVVPRFMPGAASCWGHQPGPRLVPPTLPERGLLAAQGQCRRLRGEGVRTPLSRQHPEEQLGCLRAVTASQKAAGCRRSIWFALRAEAPTWPARRRFPRNTTSRGPGSAFQQVFRDKAGGTRGELECRSTPCPGNTRLLVANKQLGHRFPSGPTDTPSVIRVPCPAFQHHCSRLENVLHREHSRDHSAFVSWVNSTVRDCGRAAGKAPAGVPAWSAPHSLRVNGQATGVGPWAECPAPAVAACTWGGS